METREARVGDDGVWQSSLRKSNRATNGYQILWIDRLCS
jgi:hypothetical protein